MAEGQVPNKPLYHSSSAGVGDKKLTKSSWLTQGQGDHASVIIVGKQSKFGKISLICYPASQSKISFLNKDKS